jgi:hypothetical protein
MNIESLYHTTRADMIIRAIDGLRIKNVRQDPKNKVCKGFFQAIT